MFVEFIDRKGHGVSFRNVHHLSLRLGIYYLWLEDGTLYTLIANEYQIAGVTK